jgi:exosortase D (VPLPA-CTERM-specific)
VSRIETVEPRGGLPDVAAPTAASLVAADASARGLRDPLLLASLIVAMGWLYHPVLAALASQWWMEEDYSHGFLIPVVSAVVAWKQRARLAALPREPSLLGHLVVATGIGLLVLGTAAAELFTMRLSLVVTLTGLVLACLGRRHVAMLAFPLSYLVFMIPPPAIVFNAVAFPLQLMAARVATAALQWLDIPVLREGNVITLANQALEVAQACSGIRSLVTLLALAAVLAHVTQTSRAGRVIVVLAAIPVAILANTARVVGTGILAHAYGDAVARGFFHTFSGWLLFVVAVVLLGGAAAFVRSITGGGAPAMDREPAEARARGGGQRGGAWKPASTVAILLGGAMAVALVSRTEAVPAHRPLEHFPKDVGAWHGVGEALPPPVLEVLRVSDYVMRLYRAPGRVPVWLYVGYYATQRQGQIIHSPQQCLPGAGWSFLSHDRARLALPGRSDAAVVNDVVIGKGDERQVVVYWYQERGRITASEYAAKLHLLGDAITRNRTDGALVRMSSTVRTSVDAARADLLEFARLSYPHLAEFLPQ